MTAIRDFTYLEHDGCEDVPAFDPCLPMTPAVWATLPRCDRRSWLAYWCPRRRTRWIAARLGCRPRAVYYRYNHLGVVPTHLGGCVTAMQAARVLNCTPQWAAALCRARRLRAHRNPQRRHWDYPIRRRLDGWWQIRLEDLAAFTGLSLDEVVRQLAEEVDRP